MSTKPILFNTDMVRAILDGRKTVTRRVMKPQPPSNIPQNYLWIPPYRPGDSLYVRETFCINNFGCHYRADWPDDNCPDMSADDKWRPSIHMPREAARIFLRVTGVRVERLQDISMKDVRNEGIEYDIERPVASYGKFVELWDSTIRPGIRALYGWGGNPWVWVIEFERYEKSEAAP